MSSQAVAFNLNAYLAAKGARGYRTDSQVAEAAQITRARLSTILSGAVPPEDTRERIARALKIRPEELWVEVRLP